jgi:hypothetical protein
VSLALCAMLCFAASNLFIAKLSPLGIEMVTYYWPGSLIPSTLFYAWYVCRVRQGHAPSGYIEEHGVLRRKILCLKGNSSFDWK